MGKPKIPNLRWKICVFLLLGTAINYMDRQVLSITKTTIGGELGITSTEFGTIFMYFSLAYAVMFTPIGRFIDAVGTKMGYAACLIFWSVVGMLHGAARSASQFILFRSLLGTAEGGSWTGGSRAAAEWFPPKERSTAIGIWNGGSSVGGILACLLVPKLVYYFGWRSTFVVIGLLGFLWLYGWFKIYAKPQDHPRITDEERELILSTQAAERPAEMEKDQERMTFMDLICHRQVWGILLYRLFTDQIWWFYVFWFPPILQEDRHLSMTWAATMMIFLFVFADIGSMSGGWFSGFLQRRGWSTTMARKTVLTVGCLVMVTGLWVSQSPLWLAVGIVSMIACFYTVASANILTIPSDVAPRHLTATVMGMSGMLAGLGGMWMNLMTGHIKDTGGSYSPMMISQAILPILAIAVVWLVTGEIKPIRKARDYTWTKPLLALAALACVLITIGGLLPHVTDGGTWIAAKALDPKLPVGLARLPADNPIMRELRDGGTIHLGFAQPPFNVPMAFRVFAVALGLFGLWTILGDLRKKTCRAPVVGLVGIVTLATAGWHVLEMALRLVNFHGVFVALSQPGFYVLIAGGAITVLAFGLAVSRKPSKAELEAMAA
jgi:MFS transporter, ACS family, hexuronate transporter